MVRYAGTREENAWYGLGQTFTVGKRQEQRHPRSIRRVVRACQRVAATPDGDLLVTAREPGFYRLRYSSQPDFAAVNIDGAEGDFTKLNFGEFMAGVTGGAGGAEGAAANRNLSDEEVEGRQRVWWSLLLVALLLLLAESFLARRTKMVKMIG